MILFSYVHIMLNIILSVGTLAQWPELLHEWVGYIVYKFLYS